MLWLHLERGSVAEGATRGPAFPVSLAGLGGLAAGTVSRWEADMLSEKAESSLLCRTSWLLERSCSA